MFRRVIDWWFKFPAIYPLYVLTVFFFLAIINKHGDLAALLFLAGGMQAVLLGWQLIEKAKHMSREDDEPEVNDSGNNYNKTKFYDHM